MNGVEGGAFEISFLEIPLPSFRKFATKDEFSGISRWWKLF